MSDTNEIPATPEGLREHVRSQTPERSPQREIDDEGPTLDLTKDLPKETHSNLREVSAEYADKIKSKAARLAAEAEGYSKAAGFQTEEREIPNLDASDQELNTEELQRVRADLAAMKAERGSDYADLLAAQQAEQAHYAHQEAERAATHAATVASQLVNEIKQVEQQLVQQLFNDFPEIGNPQELARLRAEDPWRFEEINNAYRNARGVMADAQQQVQQGVQEYAQNFANVAQAHDKEFERRHKDMLSNPEARRASREGALQYLQDAGYTAEDIELGWNYGQGKLANLRSIQMQEGLLKLWQVGEMEKKAKNVKSRGLPPVMRPGERRGNGTDAGGEHELRALNKKLNETGSLKDAAKLFAAKERYRRNG